MKKINWRRMDRLLNLLLGLGVYSAICWTKGWEWFQAHNPPSDKAGAVLIFAWLIYFVIPACSLVIFLLVYGVTVFVLDYITTED